jgi:hypothetical protein
MQQWEYLWERVGDPSPGFSTKLDKLGEQGWEAVGMWGYLSSPVWVLFKRPKAK